MAELNSADLTASIEQAFEQEWLRAKGGAAPSAGSEDRQILFAAVARGVLSYLKANEDDVITRLRVRRAGAAETLDVDDATLGIDP